MRLLYFYKEAYSSVATLWALFWKKGWVIRKRLSKFFYNSLKHLTSSILFGICPPIDLKIHEWIAKVTERKVKWRLGNTITFLFIFLLYYIISWIINVFSITKINTYQFFFYIRCIISLLEYNNKLNKKKRHFIFPDCYHSCYD